MNGSQWPLQAAYQLVIGQLIQLVRGKLCRLKEADGCVWCKLELQALFIASFWCELRIQLQSNTKLAEPFLTRSMLKIKHAGRRQIHLSGIGW